jgi:two-component system chemotaxis response regulator CheB
LSGESDLEVVGTAPDPYVARDKILALRPDVLTLDIEMPRMDGLTFLKKLMHFHPMPVIIISSLAQTSCLAALQALEFGAVEVLAKPGGPYSVGELRHNLAHKVRAAAAAHIRPEPAGAPGDARPSPPARLAAPALPPGTVLAIGASTGGTEAIANVLKRLPQRCPGMVIAQHIPAQFSRAFAKRLNDLCAMDVKEAEDGDTLRNGLALIAPGDFHMLLRHSGGRYYVSVKTGPRVSFRHHIIRTTS